MCAQSIDPSKLSTRYSNLPDEPKPKRMLPPIQGYENEDLVSLEEAVVPLIKIVPEVERMVWTVKQNSFDCEYGLTDDEIAAVLLYTMEWTPRQKSFYIILNQTLQAANRNLLKPWFFYLRLVMNSLAKIPLDSERTTVYRGVKADLSDQYSRGSTITWWGFSSCTTNIEVLDNPNFLGCTGTRTLFSIDCCSAKSVKTFSVFPHEEEVLLPPGRQFEVKGRLDQGNGLHIIQMKEIIPKYPLINPVPDPKPRPITPPDCGNPNLQRYINALYQDPVIKFISNHSAP